MSFFDQFAVDEGKIANGVFFNHGQSSFKIASTEKRDYVKEITGISTDLMSGKISEEKAEKRINRAMAKHILVDWEVVNEDGSKGETYSEESAYQKLTEYPHFREWVTSKARVYQNFRPDKTEAENLGN